MEYIVQHWLSIGAGIFLLSMILYGHYRGVIRLVVTMLAVVSTLVVVKLAMPYVTTMVSSNQAIHQTIQHAVTRMVGGKDNAPNSADPTEETASLSVVGELLLPRQLKEALETHDSHDLYEMLGVRALTEYVGDYLTEKIIQVACFLLLSIVVFLIMKLLFRGLDMVAGLPVLHGINKITGALAGGIEGLLILWLLFLVVPLVLSSGFDTMIYPQIQKSIWLSSLYHNNVLSWLVTDLMHNLF